MASHGEELNTVQRLHRLECIMGASGHSSAESTREVIRDIEMLRSRLADAQRSSHSFKNACHAFSDFNKCGNAATVESSGAEKSLNLQEIKRQCSALDAVASGASRLKEGVLALDDAVEVDISEAADRIAACRRRMFEQQGKNAEIQRNVRALLHSVLDSQRTWALQLPAVEELMKQ